MSVITLQSTADTVSLTGSRAKWSANNKATSGPNKTIVFTHTITKTPINTTEARYTLNGVVTIVNSGFDDQEMVASFVLLTIGGITVLQTFESRNRQGGNSPGANLRVAYMETDIFKTSDLSLAVVKNSDYKQFTFTATFDVPNKFNDPIVFIPFFIFTNSGGIDTTLNYQTVEYNPTLTLLNETVNIKTDITETTGFYTDFSTTVGNNGNELIDKSVERLTSIVPKGDGEYKNLISIFTSNDVKTLTVYKGPNSKALITHQFVNVPDTVISTQGSIDISSTQPTTSDETIVYYSEGWANDENDILTTAWTNLYAPLGGLTMAASNGVTVKFTKQENVALNLIPINKSTGEQILASLTDPEETDGSSALAGLLYLKLVLDSNPGSGDMIFDAERLIINLPPNAPAGLANLYRNMDGQKNSDLYAGLLDFLFGALEPSTENTVRPNFIWFIAGVAAAFVAAAATVGIAVGVYEASRSIIKRKNKL